MMEEQEADKKANAKVWGRSKTSSPTRELKRQQREDEHEWTAKPKEVLAPSVVRQMMALEFDKKHRHYR